MKRAHDRFHVLGAFALLLALLALGGPPAAAGQEGAPTRVEPESESEPIGLAVLLMGWQKDVLNPIEGNNLSGLALEAAGHSPRTYDPQAGIGFEPGAVRESLTQYLTVTEGNRFVVLYTPYTLRMDVQGMSMIWRARSPATMLFADHDAHSISGFALSRLTNPNLQTASSLEGVSPSGLVGPLTRTMTATNEWVDLAESRAERYDVDLEVALGQMGFQALQHHSGSVWLAPEHPGREIVATFYRNFASAVQGQGFFGAFAGGLTELMARLSEEGLPLAGDLEITTRARVVGMPAGRQTTHRTFRIEHAWLLPLNQELERYVVGFEDEVEAGYQEQEVETLPNTYLSGEDVEALTDPSSVGVDRTPKGIVRDGLKMWKDALPFKKHKKDKPPV